MYSNYYGMTAIYMAVCLYDLHGIIAIVNAYMYEMPTPFVGLVVRIGKFCIVGLSVSDMLMMVA